MNDSQKIDTANRSLIDLIEYANRLIASSHILGRRNYDDWIWKCNIEVQKIFGNSSPQYQAIRSLQNINNALLLGELDQAGKDSLAQEIAQKSTVLQKIVDTIQIEQIDQSYLAPEVPVEEKLVVVQGFLDDVELALASGRIQDSQYSTWHNKALPELQRCFGIGSTQSTAFGHNIMSVGLGDRFFGQRGQGQPSTGVRKFQLQKEFFEKQRDVLQGIASRQQPKRDGNSMNDTSIATTGRIFIGHGQSSAWRDLKEFLQDRLGLEWDEFNRVPVAGLSNTARLGEMLNNASFAFVVMTAEDEQIDGSINPRMNVVHEAGLFQGKLGFTKAIVLLERGCEEFSNIDGLGQIRFDKDNITGVFEEIRRVLERERIIQTSP